MYSHETLSLGVPLSHQEIYHQCVGLAATVCKNSSNGVYKNTNPIYGAQKNVIAIAEPLGADNGSV